MAAPTASETRTLVSRYQGPVETETGTACIAPDGYRVPFHRFSPNVSVRNRVWVQIIKQEIFLLFYNPFRTLYIGETVWVSGTREPFMAFLPRKG